ncbi:hypothetical protein WJ972_00185 [Achromobacter insuavis]
MQLDHGAFTRLTTDVAARGIDWAAAPGGPAVRGGYAQFRIEGTPGDFVQSEQVPLARSAGAADLSVNGRVEQLRVALPGIFEQPELGASELRWMPASRAPTRATGSSTWASCGSSTTISTCCCKASGARKARAPRAASTCAARWCAAP